MKKLFLLSFILCFGFLVAFTQQLSKKVSLVHKNAPVETVLHDLEKRYGIRFHYNSQLIQNKKRINVNLQNIPLDRALTQILEPNGLTYVVVHGYIVIKEKPRSAPVKKTSQVDIQPVLAPSQAKNEPETAVSTNPADTTAAQPAVTASVEEQPVLSAPEDSSRKLDFLERKRLEKSLDILTDSIITLQNIRETSKDTALLKTSLKELQGSAAKVIDSLAKPSFFWLKNKLEELNTDSLKPQAKAEPKAAADTIPQPRVMPFQLTFITPLGTNGLSDYKTANNASLNLLVGRSAGVKGVEIGGLGNINSGNMYGFQAAGLANIGKKDVAGIQIGGLLNTSRGKTVGLQAAGLGNIGSKELVGIQLAGLMNTSSGKTLGLQGAGLINISFKETTGGQTAGLVNISGGRLNGLQGAGVVNVTNGYLNGVQAAGVLNTMNGELLGLQAAGVGNINHGETRGMQAAGVFNLATGAMEGLQVAGVLNVAKKVTGGQIGVVNYSDTITGVPIGLFSYSRKGYKRLALWATESQMAYLGFKTGSDRFYNMLFAGVGRFSRTNMCGFGYGLGSENRLGKRFYISADLMTQTLSEIPLNFQNKMDLLNTAQVAFGVKITRRVSFYAGPSFNVYVSNRYDPGTDTYGLPIGPNRVFDEVYAGRRNPVLVAMWPGIQAGFTF